MYKKEALDSDCSGQSFFFQLHGFVPSAKMHIKADQIESADAYDCVNDSGKPRHIAKNKGYQIEAEYADQSPVDCTDYGNGKGSTVQKFISHLSPSFLRGI